MKRNLIAALRREFPDVPISPDDSSHWLVASKFFLLLAQILLTHASIQCAGSSGELSALKALAQPDLLSLPSILQRALYNIPGVNVVSCVLQATGRIDKIVINMHYKDRKEAMDIRIMDREPLLYKSTIQLEIPLPARKVWSFADGEWGQVKDVEAFENGKHYYLTGWILWATSQPVIFRPCES